MKLHALVVVTTLALGNTARAQHAEANHFVYTGELRIHETVVARANTAPLSRVHIRGHAVDVAIRHEGFTLAAEGEREGLQYHVHTWTMANAHGFEVHVPPDERFDVLDGSTERAVIVPHNTLVAVTLGRSHALPAWITAHIAAEADTYTHCGAVTLYPHPSEEGEPLDIAEGMSVYSRPSRNGFDEAWVRLDGFWVRGYGRGLACEVENSGVGIGISSAGGSYGSDPPPHVWIPQGLELVSPAYPSRVVMRVTRPIDAIAWGAGWTSANNESALMIDLPCGFGETVGALTFTPSQLMPRGAPHPS